MYVHVIIGHTGEGKTHFTKNFLLKSGKKNYVFDINNEYANFKDTEIELEDFNKFTKNCLEKTDTNFVFEDATGFMSGKTEDVMKKIVIKKRHSRNNLIFLFHSIQDVPPFIFRLSNFVVLFRTNDLAKSVKEKEPKILKQYLELRKMPKHSKKIIKMLS